MHPKFFTRRFLHFKSEDECKIKAEPKIEDRQSKRSFMQMMAFFSPMLAAFPEFK